MNVSVPGPTIKNIQVEILRKVGTELISSCILFLAVILPLSVVHLSHAQTKSDSERVFRR